MSTRPQVIRQVRELRQTVQQWRRRGERIALVPTMGGLHEGHLSLVRLAKQHVKRVVVSVFVNPTQFAPHEDYDSYPRNEERDWRKLLPVSPDVMYAPDVHEIYPHDFATRVEVAGVTQTLEGVARPQFFSGVTTVVAKLLLQCLPDVAVFGEKDYQQLLVVKRMVQDLNFPVAIVPGPIVRERDGLAMSSRNVYLDADDRSLAPQLYAVLCDLAPGALSMSPWLKAWEGSKALAFASIISIFATQRPSCPSTPLARGRRAFSSPRILAACA
jgi:pantoate--beta-alanine ligase